MRKYILVIYDQINSLSTGRPANGAKPTPHPPLPKAATSNHPTPHQPKILNNHPAPFKWVNPWKSMENHICMPECLMNTSHSIADVLTQCILELRRLAKALCNHNQIHAIIFGASIYVWLNHELLTNLTHLTQCTRDGPRRQMRKRNQADFFDPGPRAWIKCVPKSARGKTSSWVGMDSMAGAGLRPRSAAPIWSQAKFRSRPGSSGSLYLTD